jgi:DNA polymerase I-like protein with 3'-5' exonuclease and polymerase domains
VDDHLRIYTSAEDLRATIEAGDIDAHLLTAATLFSEPLEAVSREHRLWGKYLNMAAVFGLSLQGLADLTEAPLETVREMRAQYCRLVLA